MFSSFKIRQCSHRPNPTATEITGLSTEGDGFFGVSVSLNASGDILAVGANTSSEYGTIYLKNRRINETTQVNPFGLSIRNTWYGIGDLSSEYPEEIVVDPITDIASFPNDKLPSGFCVLLEGQEDDTKNGFWITDSGSWRRARHQCGRVRVFRKNADSWSQLGRPFWWQDSILGNGGEPKNSTEYTTLPSRMGGSVSLDSEGNTLFIGETWFDVDNPPAPGVNEPYNSEGQVLVYDFSNGDWGLSYKHSHNSLYAYRYGDYVATNSSGDRFVVATDSVGTGPNYPLTHSVRSFTRSGWNRIGEDLNFVAQENPYNTFHLGIIVAFSGNGMRIAISQASSIVGATYFTRIFEWTANSWRQIGPDIPGRTSSLSLNHNGTVLAVGYNGLETSVTGSVKTYGWNGSSWIQMGAAMNADANTFGLGNKVALNGDGNRLVVSGASRYAETSSSRANLYEFKNGAWSRIMSVDRNHIHFPIVQQHKQNREGPNSFGNSVAINQRGNIFAVGNTDYGTFLGAAYVYTFDLSEPPAPSKITITNQPSDQSIEGFGNASFSVSATSTNNSILSYQWERRAAGGSSFITVIGETRSSISLSNLTSANDGDEYRVVIKGTNGAPTVTSGTARLIDSGNLLAYEVVTSPISTTHGLYCLEGTYNGKKYWKKQGASSFIYWLPGGFFSGMGFMDGWYIGTSLGQRFSNVHHYNTSGSYPSAPPTGSSGWLTNASNTSSQLVNVNQSSCIPPP